MKFDTPTVQTVSASLGEDSLRAAVVSGRRRMHLPRRLARTMRRRPSCNARKKPKSSWQKWKLKPRPLTRNLVTINVAAGTGEDVMDVVLPVTIGDCLSLLLPLIPALEMSKKSEIYWERMLLLHPLTLALEMIRRNEM